MKMLRLIPCLLLAFTATTAWADDDELVEKVVVRNRLFNVDGHFEAGLNVGFSMLSRLTDHYQFTASGAYNFIDSMAVEVRVSYAYSKHTGLADKMALDFASNPSLKAHVMTNGEGGTADLADLWQMGFNAIAGLRWQPVYGKIGLLAELPIHFQAYLWAGGGVALLHRESLLICNSTFKACANYSDSAAPEFKNGTSPFYEEDKVGPLVSLALGFRFFIIGKHAVKLEFRDYSWLDSRLEHVDRIAAQNPSNPTGNGNPVASAGITNLVQIDVGYAFIF
jgi:outer membrane beta-barrel protein